MMQILKRAQLIESLGLDSMNQFERLFSIVMLFFAFSMILSVAIFQICCGALVLVWLIRWTLDPQYRYHISPLDIPILLLVCGRVISVGLSTHPDTSIAFLWKELPFYAVYFALSQNLGVRNTRYMKALIWALIGGGFIGALYGIHLHVVTGFEERAKSITSGYMTLSMFLCALVTLLLPLVEHLARRRWILWGCLAILFVALLATLGRTHIALGVLAILAYSALRYRMLFVAFPAIFAISLMISPGFRERASTVLSLNASNDGDRGVLTRDALEKVTTHPLFGYGPYTFPFIFSHYHEVNDNKISGWHDDFLQIYLESGMLALGSFVWIVVLSLRMAVKQVSFRSRSWESDLGFALTGFMIVFYLSAFLGASAFDPITAQLHRFGLAACASLGSGLSKT